MTPAPEVEIVTDRNSSLSPTAKRRRSAAGLVALALALTACEFEAEELAPEPVVPPPTIAELAQGTPAPALPGGGAALVGQAKPLLVLPLRALDRAEGETVLETVRAALERRPAARFDLVAVTPSDAVGPAEDTAAALRSVTQLLREAGLPPERLSQAAVARPQATQPSLQIFVR